MAFMTSFTSEDQCGQSHLRTSQTRLEQENLPQLRRSVDKDQEDKEQTNIHLVIRKQRICELKQTSNPFTMKNNRAGAKTNMKPSKYDMLRADTTSKISHLEAVVGAEKTRTKEIEACLSQQIQETCQLKAALVQMQQQMEDHKRQWEEDKSCFLAEQAKTVTNMSEDVIEAQEDLEGNQRHLLKLLSTMAEALKKEKEERKTSTDLLMDRIRTLEEHLGRTKTEQTNTNLCGQDSSSSENTGLKEQDLTTLSYHNSGELPVKAPNIESDEETSAPKPTNQQAVEGITSAGSDNTDLTEKHLPVINDHKRGARGRANNKRSNSVSVLTYNLSVTDNFRESVVVTCHLRDMEKLEAHRARLALKKKKTLNTSVFPSEDDFPPLQGDQPEPHTLLNKDVNQDRRIPMKTYAETLATPASKLPPVLSEVPETGETKNIHPEAPEPQPEVIAPMPTTPPELPAEDKNMESVEDNVDPTLKHLAAETSTKEHLQPGETPSKPTTPSELLVESPNMTGALQKENKERKTSTESLMDRIRTLEEQLGTTKTENTNTNLFGQEDFPPLQRDKPEPHSHPNQKGNKGTSNPQGTYAQTLSKAFWPKVSSSKRPAKWT